MLDQAKEELKGKDKRIEDLAQELKVAEVGLTAAQAAAAKAASAAPAGEAASARLK